MTLKVTIQPTGEWAGLYPTYYTLDDGVKVGQAGELMLISLVDEKSNPLEFRIYAPGTWKDINATQAED